MRFSAWRSLAILIVSAAILVLVVDWALQPIGVFLSNRYLQRGNEYFVDQDYSEAVSQYSLALRYNPKNQEAKTNQQEASAAPVDILQAKPFFQAHNVSEVLTTLQAAQGPFGSPKDALLEGLKLYDQGEYDYAQYSFVAATQLDPNYPEAWNDLGETYQKLAAFDSSNTAKAKASFAKRDAISPMYIK